MNKYEGRHKDLGDKLNFHLIRDSDEFSKLTVDKVYIKKIRLDTISSPSNLP